jgi:hypothetical protein
MSKRHTELTDARLAVNDWHACASPEELARWREAQQRLIDAARAVGREEGGAPSLGMGTTCDLCGDVDATLFLHARCHPTAPLRAEKAGDVLILCCYLPDCMREVVRLRLATDEPRDQRERGQG